MHSVLVPRSEAYPVRVDLVRETLPDDWTVDALDVDAEGMTDGSGAELGAAAAGYDAVLLRPGPADADFFAAASSVRVVAVHSSGYDHVNVDAATEHGVVVTHSPGASAPGVVEYTLCAAVTLLRDLPGTYERTTAGEWTALRERQPELGRQTVGLVGLGTVGLDVARAMSGLGAEVLAYDPYVAGERDDSPIYPRTTPAEAAGAGAELVGFDELLDRADVLSLHAPETEATRGLVGAEELAAMAGGYLINVARGGLVDETALLEAVEEGLLAGVALDVLEAEPPAPDDPLLTHEDVLVTPHVAGVTDGYLERGARLGAEKIETVLTGGRPDTVVNPAVYDAR